jgi:hypothetical protein
MNDLEKFQYIRLKLALRKRLLLRRDFTERRSFLFDQFYWVSKEIFDRVVADCLQEGTMTERIGRKGASLLTWHEEKVVGPASEATHA